MMITTNIIPIASSLLFSLLPLALLIILQVWLCKKGGKLGLILPILSLVASLLLTGALLAFTALSPGGGTLTVTNGDGEIIQQEQVQAPTDQKEFPVRTFVFCGVAFLIGNIPTAVYGGIWLHYKNRRDILDDVKKMRLEDLE